MGSLCKDAEQRRFEAGRKLATPPIGEDIVISGIAGKFPNSDDVAQFMENLMNKVDLCDEDDRRWVHTNSEIPKKSGKINYVDKFDAGHFGVHPAHANGMDPMQRMVLEKSYEAIMDAGLHPDELVGTNTGVFIGTSYSESETKNFFFNLKENSSSVTGCSRSMQAQRISYSLKLIGPSLAFDSACSSSLYALTSAYEAIRKGKCEQALVGGSQLCFQPSVTLQFARLGILNMNTGCRPFDDDVAGFTRGETVTMIFLQKSKNAKRIYAKIVHSKVNVDGYKEEGITYPSGDEQICLYQKLYEECGVDPTTLAFLEAHGTGTVVGDPVELNAIDNFFCKGRKEPLLIGSVKGNIGHTEPAAGICSVIKMIYGMDTGLIPPNIHYDKPRQSIPGLLSNRLQVVTEKTPWPTISSVGGVNSFGFGGANCHVLMKRNEKEKIIMYDNLPRLVCFSGRTPEAIQSFQTNLEHMQLDYEFIGLLHEVFQYNTESHKYRGYSIISSDGEVSKSSTYFNNEKMNVYLYIGSSANYTYKTIKELKQINAFKMSFDRCNSILKKNDIDIDLSYADSNIILNQILITLSIKIGLIDILTALEIIPDFIIDTSLGDFTSAYANGALTMEEIILSIYTVSQLVLKSHENGTNLETEILKSLKNIILSKPNKTIKPSPLRSNVFPYASPEYFMDNILNPKMLTDISKNIMDNSVVISIYSNIKSKGTFSVIDFINPEMKINNLLDAIGRLYQAGLSPKVQELYPKIKWPVSRGTPMISPLIKWDYAFDYDMPTVITNKLLQHKSNKDPEKSVIISLTNSDLMFYKGHVIDGRNFFPATGYLVLIWNFFSEIIAKDQCDFNVCFEHVKFHRATTFGKDLSVKLYLTIHKSGHFEVSDIDLHATTIVTGRIYEMENSEISDEEDDDKTMDEYETLNQKDVYKLLKLRGYNYSGPFKGIQELKGNEAMIKWAGNWVTFMDNMLQLSIFTTDSKSLYIPTGIDRLVIDAKRHISHVNSLITDQKHVNLPVVLNKAGNIIRSQFIEMSGLFTNTISRKKQIGQPILEIYKFIPNETCLSLKESIRINVQIVLENKISLHVKVLELFDNECLHDVPFSGEIQTVFGDMPLIQSDIKIVTNKNVKLDINDITVENKEFEGGNGNLIVAGSNLFGREKVLQKALSSLTEGGCLLTLEDTLQTIPDDITILTKHTIGSQQLFLIKTKENRKEATIINITNKYDGPENWMLKIQNSLKVSSKIVIYSENEEFSGILGLINCLRREPGGEKVSCVLIQGPAPKFDLNNNFYKRQIEKNLAINVLNNGSWGTYRHLLMKDSPLVENEHCYGNVTTRGDLTSLKWMEGNLGETPNEKLVQIYYSAINFRDLMTASGKISLEAITVNRLKQECIQGLEYSGRNSRGERVMGIVTGGATGTMIESTETTFPVPADWTLEDAAAVPVVYMTVLYGLIIRAKLKVGQSILIHSGTGGVGLAAINTALHYGCNIFVTVGTDAKREFLNKTYPSIKNSQIGNSRDTTFEQMIHMETNGRGVDIILNSLAEEKLQASVRCLAKGGNFLEIGKFDLTKDNPLSLELIDKGCTFHGIMLDKLKFPTDQECIKLFRQSIKDGFVKRLPLTVFKMNQLEEAYRYIGAGKHIGKVLIKIRDEEEQHVIIPKKILFKGVPRFFANPSANYILIGGLGGFGLELADWLVVRGAKHIILSSRHGIRSGYQAMMIRTWRSYGTNIVISLDDITTLEGCRSIINKANKAAPVEGVFNLGVVLKDGFFENQTITNFNISFAPKALATTYLDVVTRESCPHLKYFVAFSSVSCGRGNAEQTNYGMANSIMERICEKRKLDGLPGLAIQWGAIGDVGLVAEMQKEATEIAIGGTLQQRISSCLEMMDLFLRQDEPVVASMVVAEKTGMGCADNLVDAVVNIMGLRDLKTISHHSTLSELGMDSIMAIEIKQTLERDFDVFLSSQEMRNLSFTKLLALKENGPESISNENAEIDALIQFENIFENIYDPQTFEMPILKMEVPNKSSNALIVLFPGIEATYLRLRKLSENIKYNSICLQYITTERSIEIENIVNTAYLNIKSNISSKKEFQFIAHCFGTVVALEVASRLEKEGYVGKIALIDGSPDFINEFLKTIKLGTDEFDMMLICALLSFYFKPEAVMKLKERLTSTRNCNERQKIINESIPENSRHPKEIMLQVGKNIYNLITALSKYKPGFEKIKSKVILYKPNVPMIKNISEDLNLSILCENKIEIKEMAGNHSTILDNLELAKDLDRFFSNQ